MENFDPIEVEFLLNSEEVKQESKKIKDEIRGVADAGQKSTAAYEKDLNNLVKQLNSLNAAAKSNQATIRTSAASYSSLGNSINQIARELPSFSYSAQSGFVALSNSIPLLADEIGRLKVKNDELTESGKKGVPVSKQLGKSLLSWNAALSVGATLLTIYGPKIAEYILSLFRTQKAMEKQKLTQEALNKAMDASDYTKAVKNLTELRNVMQLAKDGTVDQTVAIKKYNDIIGNTAGTAKTLGDVEQGLIDNADAYIKMTYYKAAANLALEDAAKKALEAEKRRSTLQAEDFSVKDLTKFGAASNQFGPGGLVTALFGSDVDIKKAQDRANKAASVIETEGKSLEEIYKKFVKQAEEQGKKLNKSIFGDDSPVGKDILDGRKKLLQQIAALDLEYARKRLSKDDEELQALKDKFDKIRNAVLEFNKNPKNKVKIELADLDNTFVRAEADLKYKQATAHLKDELEEQKKIYAEFEEYQNTFGTAAAKEKYKDQLLEYDNYIDLLKAKIEANKNAYDTTATGPEQDRAKLLDDALQKENTAQDKAHTKLLAGLQSYEQKRLVLIQQFEKKRKELLADGRFSEENELTKSFYESLDKLDTAHAEATKEYKALLDGVDNLSDEAAKNVVANAHKMVQALMDAGYLSEEAAKNVNKKISGFQDALDKRSSKTRQEKMYDLADVFGTVGSELSAAGDKMLQVVGEMLQGIAGAVATLGNSNASGLQKATSLVGLIVQAGNMIKEIGDQSYFSEVNDQKQVNKALAERLTMEKKLNDLKRERAEIERNSSAFLDSYYKNDFAASLNKQLESEEELKKSMQALSTNGVFSQEGIGKRLLFGTKTENRDFSIGQIISDYFPTDYFKLDPQRDGNDARARFLDPLSIFGGYSDIKVSQDALKKLRKSFDETLQAMGKTSADVANFSSREWLEFYTLLDESGKITDQGTKKLLENAKTAAAEYQQALDEMRDTISKFAGSLGDELGNSLIKGFQQGTDAAEVFKDSLNNILTNLFVQDLVNTQFRQYFDKLQSEMEKSMGVDGDKSWLDDIEQFAKDVNPALEQAQVALGAFDQALRNKGYAGFGSDTKDSERGLQGAIRREMTEETASELTGLFRGQYDVTKQQFQITQKHFELEQKNFDNTLDIMQKTALIEQHTSNTVMQLQFAVVELKNITKNTKPSQTSRDLGLG